MVEEAKHVGNIPGGAMYCIRYNQHIQRCHLSLAPRSGRKLRSLGWLGREGGGEVLPLALRGAYIVRDEAHVAGRRRAMLMVEPQPLSMTSETLNCQDAPEQVRLNWKLSRFDAEVGGDGQLECPFR